jgi:hypothetical protein
MGPFAGRLLAALVIGPPTGSMDLAPFDPARAQTSATSLLAALR